LIGGDFVLISIQNSRIQQSGEKVIYRLSSL